MVNVTDHDDGKELRKALLLFYTELFKPLEIQYPSLMPIFKVANIELFDEVIADLENRYYKPGELIFERRSDDYPCSVYLKIVVGHSCSTEDCGCPRCACVLNVDSKNLQSDASICREMVTKKLLQQFLH